MNAALTGTRSFLTADLKYSRRKKCFVMPKLDGFGWTLNGFEASVIGKRSFHKLQMAYKGTVVYEAVVTNSGPIKQSLDHFRGIVENGEFTFRGSPSGLRIRVALSRGI